MTCVGHDKQSDLTLQENSSKGERGGGVCLMPSYVYFEEARQVRRPVRVRAYNERDVLNTLTTAPVRRAYIEGVHLTYVMHIIRKKV